MYSTQVNIEAFLQRSLTSNEETLLSAVQTAVDNWINHTLRGLFGSAEESTRYYDGGSSIVDIDPANDVTNVQLVSSDKTVTHTYTLNEDFESQPISEDIKRWIEKRDGKFPSGLSNIAVTATFVLASEVPEDISYLATYLVGKMFGESVTGDLTRESIEGYSRSFKTFVANDETAKMILDQYTDDDVLL